MHLPPLCQSSPFTRVAPSVHSVVLDMWDQEVLEPATGKVFLSQVFTGLKQTSMTSHLVANINHLNRFIDSYKFHTFMAAQAHLAFHLGAWFVTFDHKEAYWHIPIMPRYRCFLAIQVRETVLQFTVLPFGLNLAPWVFTKMI